MLPDINNRIQRGEVKALFGSEVKEIREEEIVVSTPQGSVTMENDFVLAMIGYHPDVDFLQKLGVEVHVDTCVPQHDPETLETGIKGIYIAGAIVSGKMTNRIFIENGRFHGIQIFKYWDKNGH